jgi:ATP-dependent DNA helicase RecG
MLITPDLTLLAPDLTETNKQKFGKKCYWIFLIGKEEKEIKSFRIDEIILNLCAIKPLTLEELSELLNSQMDPLLKKYISRLLKERKLELLYLEQVNHPKQAYMIRSLFTNQH